MNTIREWDEHFAEQETAQLQQIVDRLHFDELDTIKRRVLCHFYPDAAPRTFVVRILRGQIKHVAEDSACPDIHGDGWRTKYVEDHIGPGNIPDELEGPVWIPDPVLLRWLRTEDRSAYFARVHAFEHRHTAHLEG